jgi:hypothetical protein
MLLSVDKSVPYLCHLLLIRLITLKRQSLDRFQQDRLTIAILNGLETGGGGAAPTQGFYPCTPFKNQKGLLYHIPSMGGNQPNLTITLLFGQSINVWIRLCFCTASQKRMRSQNGRTLAGVVLTKLQ